GPHPDRGPHTTTHTTRERVCSVTTAEGVHPAPFRTRKLSPPAPLVLHGEPCGRVGHRGTTLHHHRQPPTTGRLSALWAPHRARVSRGWPERGWRTTTAARTAARAMATTADVSALVAGRAVTEARGKPAAAPAARGAASPVPVRAGQAAVRGSRDPGDDGDRATAARRRAAPTAARTGRPMDAGGLPQGRPAGLGHAARAGLARQAAVELPAPVAPGWDVAAQVGQARQAGIGVREP